MYEEIIKQLKAENSRLKTRVEEITRENCILKSEHQLVEQIKSSDETCNHYTGITKLVITILVITILAAYFQCTNT